MWALDYRPTNFSEVVEQADAIKTLKSSIGKSTTYILHGDSGVGKTTIARIFANHVNGEAIEINGADTNGVDDVRNLISSASYIPAFNDYRVFIIDECHMLTTAAWNALLKVLEESPKTTLWMLCTTEYAKIPQTIKSRSTMVPLKRISKQAMKDHLSKIANEKSVEISNEVLNEIIIRSEGRLREAVVSLEHYAMTQELPYTFSTLDAIRFLTDIFSNNTLKVTESLNQIRNEDVHTIIRFINDYLKLLLLRNDLGRDVSTETILDSYTSISSSYIEDLRILQEEIWKSVPTGQEQVKASIEFMYQFYDKLMTHYNDFRDSRLSLSVATLYIMGTLND